MPDDTDQPDPTTVPDEAAHDVAGWDAVQVLRDRAAATRRQRDQAIAELRASLTDEQILDDFGINLDEIER